MTAVERPVVASVAQGPDVAQLLAEAGLPVAGLDSAWRTWVVSASAAGVRDVVGCVALERYAAAPDRPPVFLLRSLAVREDARGFGAGRALVAAALDAADADAGATAVVALLTESADDYFPRFGFDPVPRADLPTELRASAELSGACPDSARAYLRTP